MITYVSLEYSTDGPMPSNIDQTLEGAGLHRCGTYYALELASEDAMGAALDRLHLALQGSGVRYRLHDSIPGNVTTSSSHTVGGERGSAQAMDRTSSDTDLDASGRKAEDGARKKAMAAIDSFLRTNGGATLPDIGAACSLNENEVAGMLDAMIEEGQVTAHFQGHCILYKHTGPMLRALCR